MFTVPVQNNPPTITVRGSTNGALQLLISGDAGPDYTIEASTNLVDWEAVFTTNAPAMPFSWGEPSATNLSPRFYRVWLEP
jgi:hypothetical protein